MAKTKQADERNSAKEIMASVANLGSGVESFKNDLAKMGHDAPIFLRCFVAFARKDVDALAVLENDALSKENGVSKDPEFALLVRKYKTILVLRGCESKSDPGLLTDKEEINPCSLNCRA